MNLKKRLKLKKITVGSWITIGDSSVAEIMAKSDFDWLVVDMEHSAIELDAAQKLIRIIELAGCIPLVRVGENNPALIKRVMDAGAHGVVVPMVNSKEEAIRAVRAVKYPPGGIRGVGLARAQGYGMSFESYKNWLNQNSIVIVQIEHINAVKNLQQILDVEGVDGFIVGPYDLSGSIGKPGEFNDPEVKAALERIKIVAEQLHKPSGIHVIPPDYREVNKRIKEGYSFIAFSLDTLFLGKSCRNGLSKITR
ncbi:MAG: aldolase/citrate lyase family protein [Patescibacteria group bacterium]